MVFSSTTSQYCVLCLPAGDAEIESLPEEKQVQFQEMRCAAAGRGSMYDSVAGELKFKA